LKRFVCPRLSPNGTRLLGRDHNAGKAGTAPIFRLERKPSWSSWRFLRPSFLELSLEVGWKSWCARAFQALEARKVWDCDGGRSRGVVLSSQLIGYEELLGCATMSPARPRLVVAYEAEALTANFGSEAYAVARRRRSLQSSGSRTAHACPRRARSSGLSSRAQMSIGRRRQIGVFLPYGERELVMARLGMPAPPQWRRASHQHPQPQTEGGCPCGRGACETNRGRR
jgi:hypothetical protein